MFFSVCKARFDEFLNHPDHCFWSKSVSCVIIVVTDLGCPEDKLWPFDLISTHLSGKWRSNRNQLLKSPFESFKLNKLHATSLGRDHFTSIDLSWPRKGNNVSANHEYHFVTPCICIVYHRPKRQSSQAKVIRYAAGDGFSLKCPDDNILGHGSLQPVRLFPNV